MVHVAALLSALVLAGITSAQVPEVLLVRPSLDCTLLATRAGGSLVAAGPTGLFAVSPLPELVPTTGDWWHADTDVLDLAGSGDWTVAALGDAGLRSWNGQTPLSDPLDTALPARRLSLSGSRGVAAAGSTLTLFELLPQGPQVRSGLELDSACEALLLADTLVYAATGEGLTVLAVSAQALVHRVDIATESPVIRMRLGAGELLTLHDDGRLERRPLDGQGRPGLPDAWAGPYAPADVIQLADGQYLCSIPEVGLLPLAWPQASPALPGNARRFSTHCGHLLPLEPGRFACAEGPDGGALYLGDGDGVPQALGRFSTRVLPVRLERDLLLPDHHWLLDGQLGWRRLHNRTLEERMQLSFPRPVIGGGVYADWGGAVTAGAGLRFYRIFPDSAVIQGIHSTDPIVDVAIGPELMLAYVTAGGFVAIKQINAFPYTLFHYGTINLSCLPGAAFWVGNQFFLGSRDGRLFHVDVTNPLAPVLVETLQLAGPVLDADLYPPAALDRVLVAAGDLYRFDLAGSGPLMPVDSWHAPEGPVTCASVGELVCYATGGDSPVIGAFPESRNAPLAPWGIPVTTPAPALVDLEDTGELEVLGLADDGRLLRFSFNELDNPPRPDTTRPSALELGAFPNPANPSTHISFRLDHRARPALRVYDLQGRRLLDLDPGPLPAGTHSLPLDLSALPSALYLVELQAADQREWLKLSVLK
jgi:hypothetical protein